MIAASLNESIARLWADPDFLRVSAGNPSESIMALYLRTGPYARPLPGLVRASQPQLARGLTWKLPDVAGVIEGLAAHEGLVSDAKHDLFWIPTQLQPSGPSELKRWEIEVYMLPLGSPVRDAAVEAIAQVKITQPFAYTEQATFALTSPPSSLAPHADPAVTIDPAATRTRTLDERAFAQFWRAYPVKLDKPKSWRKWQAKGLTQDLSAILEHLAAHGHDKGLGRPLSYLRDRVWEFPMPDAPLRANASPTLFHAVPQGPVVSVRQIQSTGISTSEYCVLTAKNTPELTKMAREMNDLGYLTFPETNKQMFDWYGRGINAELLRDAVWRARAVHPTGRISVNYLNPILNQILESIEAGTYISAQEASRMAGKTPQEIRDSKASGRTQRSGRGGQRKTREPSISELGGQHEDLMTKSYYDPAGGIGPTDDASNMVYLKNELEKQNREMAELDAMIELKKSNAACAER